MKREKGKKAENWNWQAREAKFGAESEISSEYDICSHYGSSFSEDEDAFSISNIKVGALKRSVTKIEAKLKPLNTITSKSKQPKKRRGVSIKGDSDWCTRYV